VLARNRVSGTAIRKDAVTGMATAPTKHTDCHADSESAAPRIAAPSSGFEIL
jgi:hypothetical protein